jgi:hypothetical protein
MGRVVGVAEANRGNDLLNDVEQILFSALSDLAGREGRRGVRDEERAQAFSHLGAPDQGLDALGEVDDLFETAGAEPEHLRHIASTL